jgi:hypothetical protein
MKGRPEIGKHSVEKKDAFIAAPLHHQAFTSFLKAFIKQKITQPITQIRFDPCKSP